MTDDLDARATTDFLHEAGHLKHTPRAGWQLAGLRPESVAEHSYRVAVIAYVIATMEGANADRAATLAAFHDLPEARTGDVPSVGRRYVQLVDARDVAADQTARLPEVIRDAVRAVIGEFESRATVEAQCAKDADRLESLLQAREYEGRGNPQARHWVDSMVRAMVTESGKRLAAAALEGSPDGWWREFVIRYGRPIESP